MARFFRRKGASAQVSRDVEEECAQNGLDRVKEVTNHLKKTSRVVRDHDTKMTADAKAYNALGQSLVKAASREHAQDGCYALALSQFGDLISQKGLRMEKQSERWNSCFADPLQSTATDVSAYCKSSHKAYDKAWQSFTSAAGKAAAHKVKTGNKLDVQKLYSHLVESGRQKVEFDETFTDVQHTYERARSQEDYVMLRICVQQYTDLLEASEVDVTVMGEISSYMSDLQKWIVEESAYLKDHAIERRDVQMADMAQEEVHKWDTLITVLAQPEGHVLSAVVSIPLEDSHRLSSFFSSLVVCFDAYDELLPLLRLWISCESCDIVSLFEQRAYGARVLQCALKQRCAPYAKSAFGHLIAEVCESPHLFNPESDDGIRRICDRVESTLSALLNTVSQVSPLLIILCKLVNNLSEKRHDKATLIPAVFTHHFAYLVFREPHEWGLVEARPSLEAYSALMLIHVVLVYMGDGKWFEQSVFGYDRLNSCIDLHGRILFEFFEAIMSDKRDAIPPFTAEDAKGDLQCVRSFLSDHYDTITRQLVELELRDEVFLLAEGLAKVEKSDKDTQMEQRAVLTSSLLEGNGLANDDSQCDSSETTMFPLRTRSDEVIRTSYTSSPSSPHSPASGVREAKALDAVDEVDDDDGEECVDDVYNDDGEDDVDVDDVPQTPPLPQPLPRPPQPQAQRKSPPKGQPRAAQSPKSALRASGGQVGTARARALPPPPQSSPNTSQRSPNASQRSPGTPQRPPPGPSPKSPPRAPQGPRKKVIRRPIKRVLKVVKKNSKATKAQLPKALPRKKPLPLPERGNASSAFPQLPPPPDSLPVRGRSPGARRRLGGARAMRKSYAPGSLKLPRKQLPNPPPRAHRESPI